MVADYLLNPARSSHALNDLAFDHLGYELPPEDAEGALAARAAATYALWGIWQERLREENLDGLNRDLEVPLISVLARMEREGIAVAVDRLRALAARLNQEAQALEKEIHELAGMEFNIGSTKQLQFVLFEKLGLPPEKKTKTGYSPGWRCWRTVAPPSHCRKDPGLSRADETALDLCRGAAAPDRSSDRPGPYLPQPGGGGNGEALFKRAKPAETFQSAPRIGREIRRTFIAPTGTLLVSADYSQIELRLLAHVTGDKEMVRAFNADEDIHVTTASALFGVPEAEVTGEMRRRAKTVNFAVIYGMSEFGLARDLGVSPPVAREWIANYFRAVSGGVGVQREGDRAGTA